MNSTHSPSNLADVDECTTGTDDCEDNAECTNNDGSFSCSCNNGWTGDGKTCTNGDYELFIDRSIFITIKYQCINIFISLFIFHHFNLNTYILFV